MGERWVYRRWVGNNNLVRFEVVNGTTNLLISAEQNLEEEAARSVKKYRGQIEDYIAEDPEFEHSLRPVEIREDAPAIIKDMARQARVAGVGPMASVAGAIAEYVGRDLLKYSREVIIENGGDIFIRSSKSRRVGIYAGSSSSFTGKLALEIPPTEKSGLGISTSSGTIGHSLSFGNADVALAVSPSASLSDAGATALGNLVKEPSDIQKAINLARAIPGLKGALVIMGESLGIWGEVKIAKV